MNDVILHYRIHIPSFVAHLTTSSPNARIASFNLSPTTMCAYSSTASDERKRLPLSDTTHCASRYALMGFIVLPPELSNNIPHLSYGILADMSASWNDCIAIVLISRILVLRLTKYTLHLAVPLVAFHACIRATIFFGRTHDRELHMAFHTCMLVELRCHVGVEHNVCKFAQIVPQCKQIDRL